MKKTIILAAALILALALLAGCTISPIPPEPSAAPTPAAPTATPDVTAGPGATPSPEPSEEPTPTPEPTPEVPEKIYATVTSSSSVVNADDGVMILSVENGSILVKSSRSAVSDAIAAAFDELDDEFQLRVGDLRAYAVEQYDRAVEDGTDGFWNPCGLVRRFEPARVDENAVSVLMTESEYLGGAHDSPYVSALNFDTDTGEELTLRSVCAAGDHSLEDYINSRLAAIGARHELAEAFFEGWEDTLGTLVLDDVWYFDAEGITVICNTYLIAPYAAGDIRLTVPYAELTSLLDAKYFPPKHEEDLGGGELVVSDTEPADVTSTNRIVRDEGGKKFYFTTEGTLYNVRITLGTSNFETLEYVPVRDVYALSRMTPDDCIAVQTFIPEILPDLMISYVSGGEEKSFLISESGMDGSVYLIPQD
ncbi:MAG: DUF3298 domain-containing protein [Oscillospiraceae bacterium]|nr:DUF3298 domain-containing protein [Oscillospiraceae bacterium]